MKFISLVALTLFGFGGFLAFTHASATACTPHPDNPDGCNNWPPRRVELDGVKLQKPLPWPGPVCLSCPPNLVLEDRLIQKRDVLVPENSLQRSSVEQNLPQKLHTPFSNR